MSAEVVPAPRRIAVFRALQLGDMLCAVPAMRALKRADDANRITLIGLPWAEELLRRYPAYLDDFIAFPGWPGIPEREPDNTRAHEYEHQATHRLLDLAVQMHGDGSVTNAFIAATPAKAHAGFAPDEASCVDAGFMAYPRDLPEVGRLLRLAAHLGATDLDPTPEFPVSEAERTEAASILASVGVRAGESYVCVHAGGRGVDRRWPARAFAAVADAITAAGLPVVLTGSEIDRPVNEAVRGHASNALVDVTGRTTIGSLAALIEGARLLVTNDSAPSHLAAALRVPSVVIFTGSDRNRWEPADRALHIGVGEGCPDGGQAAVPPSVVEVKDAVGLALRGRPTSGIVT